MVKYNDVSGGSNKEPAESVPAKLTLEDGSTFWGFSFGYPQSTAGEVIFNTGMTGYPETLTDPSYYGQILVFTYPLIGNYGIPEQVDLEGLSSHFESNNIQVKALLISDYSSSYSHWRAEKSLSQWLRENHVPALSGIDTRALTRKLRDKGSMLGKIDFNGENIDFYNPNEDNLVAEVSSNKPVLHGKGTKRVVLIDCGAKENIIRNLLRRKVEVLCVPWDYDITDEKYDGLVISNGPGNPKMCRKTMLTVQQAFSGEQPVFGICLGHQIMALAAGANTFKLKYGHHSQNQPVHELGRNLCFVTSQNHGYAVDTKTLSPDWEPWFANLNDQTNEGMRHISRPFMSVQFHPEASPGPSDTEFLFDEFVRKLY